MTLKSSVVIFQALKPLQPQWPQWPQQPQWPQWPQQPHFIKKITDSDVLIIPSTHMTNTSPFLWHGSSKNSIFHWYLILFLSEAVKASWCNFFENWLMKHKSPNLLKPLDTIVHQNSQFYYPSELFSFHHFTMRHPVLNVILHLMIENLYVHLKHINNMYS